MQFFIIPLAYLIGYNLEFFGIKYTLSGIKIPNKTISNEYPQSSVRHIHLEFPNAKNLHPL